jgi:hypothetical protein
VPVNNSSAAGSVAPSVEMLQPSHAMPAIQNTCTIFNGPIVS